jgi:hypothetical protein
LSLCRHRPRTGARSACCPGGPAHPGERRQGGAGRHLPGSADERARRGAVRVLLHVAAGDGHPCGDAPSASRRSRSGRCRPTGSSPRVRIKRLFSRLRPRSAPDVEIWNRKGVWPQDGKSRPRGV